MTRPRDIADSINRINSSAADATAVTIDSSENVGVGISAPDGKVHAFSADASQTANAAANQFVAENSGNAGMSILSGSTSTGNVYFADNGDNAIGFIQYKHSDNYLRFGTAGSERMRILSGGGLTFNGDTATANALDDYEEGTWTPTYFISGATFSMSLEVGTYVKVGRMVHATARVRGQRSGGSGVLLLTGLPFTSESTTNINSACSIGFTNGWSTSPKGAITGNNATSISFRKSGSTSALSNIVDDITQSDVSTSSTSSNDLILSVTYRTS